MFLKMKTIKQQMIKMKINLIFLKYNHKRYLIKIYLKIKYYNALIKLLKTNYEII